MTDPRDKDGLFDGPTLSADGRLEQRLGKVEGPARPEDFEPPAPPAEKLELRDVPPRPLEERLEQFREERAARSRRPWALKLVVGLFALGAALLAAFLVFKPKLEVPLPDGVRSSTMLDGLRGGRPSKPLLINSTPPGATITIGSQRIGVTPWAGDNIWTGPQKVQLSAPGYSKWESTIDVGVMSTIDAQLVK